MRFTVASILLLVGTCSNQRHSEKVRDLKASIVYDNTSQVDTYVKTITEKDLKNIFTKSHQINMLEEWLAKMDIMTFVII